ncbi:ABC transporter substrate-binding protein [Alicyclobacillus acidiphilus]|uniref:ABC transporter substrate-binding protein n=1 Tax=Alicyclobacillus acidiphilus TaxID=182455 RepID=UPI0008363FB9|nr:ABC transporter substrate-binding protein [Alicyclobacillus acidiphilus]
MGRTHNRFYIGASSITILMLLGGCGVSRENQSVTPPAAASVAVTGAVSVKDGTGATIALKKPATSFVCLDPSSIEMLKDLGVGPKNIAILNGYQSFAKLFYGSAANKMRVIGGSWEQPNVEDILAAHPDLVIGDAYPHAELKSALKGATEMYLISRSGGYQQSMNDLVNLGILTGHKTTAEKDVKQFDNALKKAEAKSPKNQTSLIIWGTSPTDFSVPTIDDPSASVLAAISKYPWGGHGAQGMNLSLDQILKVNPDVIFVESIGKLDGDANAPSLTSQLASNPLWKHLKAVKDHRVYEVNPLIWHDDRGGLGLETILNQAMPKLYPHQKTS